MSEEFVRPDLAIEPTARIKGISEIESNIADVKNRAIAIKKFYENVVFTEEDTKLAKDEKAKINKMIDAVKKYRQNVVTDFKKPIEQFEAEAKDTEKILREAYDTINNTVKKFEDTKKKEIEKNIVSYFNELIEAEHIDFVTFKNTGINITLSASEKSLKAAALDFVNRVKSDIQLINTQQYPVEILAEYKICLNVSQAIMTVTQRMARIEEERARREEEQKRIAEEKAAMESLEKNIPAEEPSEPSFEIPVEIVEEQTFEVPAEISDTEMLADQELLTMTFSVTGTITQLRDLKQYIIERGIKIND